MQTANLTAEFMLSLPATQAIVLEAFGVETTISELDLFLSKTNNYIEGVYYRVNGAGCGYAGVGNGLYLGRDKEAINAFYNIDGDFEVSTLVEKEPIEWLDLMSYEAFDNFVSSLGFDIVNSDRVGQVVMNMGFDGIRYYDVLATGEEFVLFNTSKIG
jgi:hypothetical protein